MISDTKVLLVTSCNHILPLEHLLPLIDLVLYPTTCFSPCCNLPSEYLKRSNSSITFLMNISFYLKSKTSDMFALIKTMVFMIALTMKAFGRTIYFILWKKTVENRGLFGSLVNIATKE